MPPFFVFMEDNFSSISEILNEKLFNTNKSSIIIKYSTIFSFWEQIVAKKFINSTKPKAIKNSKIYILCKNSVVAQEISMHKTLILNKLKTYAQPLDVIISDLVVNFKDWQNEKDIEQDNGFNLIEDKKLDEIKVDESQFEEAFKNIDKSEYLDDMQKKKFKERILKLQKAKILRNS